MRLLAFTTLFCCHAAVAVFGQSDFRVPPYVQNPALDGMTVMWFSNADEPGRLVLSDAEGPIDTVMSVPTEAPELEYALWSVRPDDFPDGTIPDAPYRHSVRFEGLTGNAEYSYEVLQGASRFASSFRTSAGVRNPIRFMVYGDSETEPQSHGNHAAWRDPTDTVEDRVYLVDQSVGYASNLAIMRARDPSFVVIAGDLVQSAGEQLDWDEFWKHNTHPTDPDSSLGGSTPILPVPGNHEYYSSPHSFSNDTPKRYRQPWSDMAIDRYDAYFQMPSNGGGQSDNRYYRLDYGPVSVIGLDVSNNGVNQNPEDTNFELLGDLDAGGGSSPSFGPGSPQYEWLEANLIDAREERPFTFVVLHYAPYSVGPHGWPAGNGDSEDPLSGVPVRILTPLFMKYGVDAVFAGHDEMWERSTIDGFETRPDGTEREHRIHFYDVGTGGDGLRGPEAGLENPQQAFLVHTDVPEHWEATTLVDGGKHYGHLEVDVHQTSWGVWEAVLTPAYSFPLFQNGLYMGFERRTYDDVVILTTSDSLRTISTESTHPADRRLRLAAPFPNPMTSSSTVSFELGAPDVVKLEVYDVLGRLVRQLAAGPLNAGRHSYVWDGKDESARQLAPGTYFARLQVEQASEVVPLVIAR